MHALLRFAQIPPADTFSTGEIYPHVITPLSCTRLGQPDGISPSKMAEMLEVDEAGSKVRC